MSTYRYRYFGGPLDVRYRLVAAVEYLSASLKAAFQLAAAPSNDPVKSLYASFHLLRNVSEDLHAKYRDQFPDWQHEGTDKYGETGLWRARMDCLDFIFDQLEEKGAIKEADRGGNIGRIRSLIALYEFNNAATSEYRFRHALDYNASNYDGSPRIQLDRMAPVIQAVLPQLASIDVESLRASKTAHATNKSTTNQDPNPPGP